MASYPKVFPCDATFSHATVRALLDGKGTFKPTASPPHQHPLPSTPAPAAPCPPWPQEAIKSPRTPFLLGALWGRKPCRYVRRMTYDWPRGKFSLSTTGNRANAASESGGCFGFGRRTISRRLSRVLPGALSLAARIRGDTLASSGDRHAIRYITYLCFMLHPSNGPPNPRYNITTIVPRSSSCLNYRRQVFHPPPCYTE